jgi:hypothetical protein
MEPEIAMLRVTFLLWALLFFIIWAILEEIDK